MRNCLFALLALLIRLPFVQSAEPTLVAHWPLESDAREQISNLKSEPEAVQFSNPLSAAQFDGRDSIIRVQDASAQLNLGSQPFTISVQVRADASTEDSPGDILSLFDPATRTGLQLGIATQTGVTNSQPNSRQLHFSIDQGRIESAFTDHGKLGNAVYIFSLCVHQGRLYASTCHPGETESGRVYRFEEGDRWTDLGSPDKANAVSAMAVFEGQLYVASSKYRLAGSSLSESQNPHFGGGIYRLGPDDKWIACGRLSAETEAVGSLVVFKDQLYAGSLYKPAGFFRYDGQETWTALPTPNGKRVEAMTVFNGGLFASCYDEGSVFRFDGQAWEQVGAIPMATQTYGFAVHRAQLYVSEWPQAHVYRYLGGTRWEDTGRLGNELEAMPLLVHNGKLYSGSLPLGEVYRFDETAWTRIDQVDRTPDVKYRRAWSMAHYRGRLFVGTLPSGRVVSIEAGRNATWDHEFPTGWHHVAAVRDTERLRLYVDGKQVAQSAAFDSRQYDLTTTAGLQIGLGAHDHFDGAIKNLRIYRGALSVESISELAGESP